MRELRSRIGQGHNAIVEANGTELYYEVHGSGSPLLFISGATGDAGHFTHVADALSDDFRVITYDRRGNSRSPRPAGWTQTSITEQADDAAALLEALPVTSPVVFGTRGGGTHLQGVAPPASRCSEGCERTGAGADVGEPERGRSGRPGPAVDRGRVRNRRAASRTRAVHPMGRHGRGLRSNGSRSSRAHARQRRSVLRPGGPTVHVVCRSEEHTSEL